MPPLKKIAKSSFLLVLCSLILLGKPAPIQAQSSLTLSLESLELDQFPKITVYLNAYDAQGKFVPGMDLDNFRIFEDGVERTINEAQELEPGLHTIIALNLGATLSNRANQAVPTRYEETSYALTSWLKGIGTGATNQYSLTSNEGTLVESAQEKSSFTNMLENYNPNLYNFEPDLTSLTRALEIAAKPSLIEQSKKAILYITPLPLDQDLANLLAMQTQAIEAKVPINIWLVAPDTAANSPALQYLNQLATATGGKFYFFAEGSETPNPEEYVGKLRNTYRLRYTSTVSQSGDHTVRALVTYGNLSAETPDKQFTIVLSQPSATLINLPDMINREYVENAETGGKILQPAVTTLQAAITFPDGYERQLKASRLYIDGEVMAENTEAPFDYFGWELDDYQFSGEHLAAIEVEDILGFRNISPPVSITVNVASLYPAWITNLLKLINQGGWIPILVIVLGGSVLVGFRLRRQSIAAREAAGESIFQDGTPDPMLQAVPGLNASIDDLIYSANNRNEAEIDPRDAAPRLLVIEKQPAAAELTFKQIILEDEETTIGSDEEQVDYVITSHAISPAHALITKSNRGSVTIADLGSESGTWVNYAPISKAGVLLHNGDLVQIGKLKFRYSIGKMN